MSTIQEIFGDVIYAVTREMLIDDGALVDMTEWASREKGFHGGYTCPVAVTAAVNADLNAITKGSHQDLRGRAHDMLYLSKFAIDGAVSQHRRSGRPMPPKIETYFQVTMQVGRKKLYTYKVVLAPNMEGDPEVTILQPHED